MKVILESCELTVEGEFVSQDKQDGRVGSVRVTQLKYSPCEKTTFLSGWCNSLCLDHLKVAAAKRRQSPGGQDGYGAAIYCNWNGSLAHTVSLPPSGVFEELPQLASSISLQWLLSSLLTFLFACFFLPSLYRCYLFLILKAPTFLASFSARLATTNHITWHMRWLPHLTFPYLNTFPWQQDSNALLLGAICFQPYSQLGFRGNHPYESIYLLIAPLELPNISLLPTVCWNETWASWKSWHPELISNHFLHSFFVHQKKTKLQARFFLYTASMLIVNTY